MREKTKTSYSSTELVALATTVGITLGVAEAIRVLFSVHSISTLELALLLTYASLGHGLLSAIAAAMYILALRIFGSGRKESFTPESAVGIGVAAYSSIYFIWALPRELFWLVPGCIFTAFVVGIVGRWIASHIRLLQRLSFWSAANAILLVVAVRLTAREQDRGPIIWYLAGVIGVLLLISFLKIPTGNRLWIRPAVNNACLLILIGLMPPIVSALDFAHDTVKSKAPRPNVLLISADTLRADRLGCYGYARARTPVIDALSKESALFEQATSPMPHTGPSHTSMLTGLYPVHHGALTNGTPLKDGAVTISDLLSDEGYRSAAFISGWTLKDAACGLASRFNYYDEDFSRWSMLPEVVVLKLHLLQQFIAVASILGYYQEPLERAGESTTDRALSWLSHNRDKPFFLFVHYFDAHSPHMPPPPYDTMHDPNYRGDPTLFSDYLPLEVQLRILSDSRHVEHQKALYDGEISYVDTQIGRLLKALRELELTEDTLVIFTADHGESLTEHNFFFNHGEYLYETCVRVPLIMRFPDRRYAGVRKNNQVRLVDLAPTILQITGAKRKLTYDGQSLLPVLTASEKQERVSFGSTHSQKVSNFRSRYYVREKGYKLIWNFDVREPFSSHPVFEELYDLTSDGGELNNLIFQQPEVLEILRKDLGSWIQDWPSKTEGLSEEVKERLRALGYL